MYGFAETIANLGTARAVPKPGLGLAAGRLTPLTAPAANPGALSAKAYIPGGLTPSAPLVVVLHGCTQTADGYDTASGWSELAEARGFALLYPEQNRANNPNLCFNWFLPGDVARGAGEAGSIRAMIAAMVAAHDIDQARVYITGLSAGGAMTAAMLAAYPEVFAGGAIIAGLPAGRATNVAEALQQMRSASALATGPSLRTASDHKGPWPTLSVWHGDADHVVNPANARAIVEDWREIHDIDAPAAVDQIDGQRRSVWRDAADRDVIEEYTIAGMGHGVPLATRGPDALGFAGPHMLEAGISSTRHIARFWALEPRAGKAAPVVAPPPEVSATRAGLLPLSALARSPGRVIEDALRAAGLMR